ncbi:hemolysin family protein [Pseudactinotalea sp. Z1748]|uniref:hemolysin family protein n=1 Tax=Pseudactinotalea sp. Z1748 TaxID=3413027 RepID=UPI003C7B4065
MSGGWAIAITAFLLLFNAFFVGAEFALVAARRTKVEPMVEAGNRRAKITLRAMERVSLMMAGAQMGITVCSLLLLVISEPAIERAIAGPLEEIGVPAALTHPIAFVISLVLITFLHVVLGEMVPKNIALAGPEKAALILAPVLVGIVWLAYPVLWTLNELANLVLRAIRVQPKEEVTSAFTRNEVSELVAESRSGGLIELNDERLLQGALRFGERSTRSVLLPIDTIRTLPPDITPAQAEEVSAESFSRFPIQLPDGTMRGYVHLKDLLQNDAEKRKQPIDPAIVRDLPSVTVTDSLQHVLGVMQASSAHLALVHDSEGPAHRAPVLGLVTLEDVIEELVGVIRDDSRRQHHG